MQTQFVINFQANIWMEEDVGSKRTGTTLSPTLPNQVAEPYYTAKVFVSNSTPTHNLLQIPIIQMY